MSAFKEFTTRAGHTCLALFLFACPVQADESRDLQAVRQELATMQKTLLELQKDFRSLKDALTARNDKPEAYINVGDSPVLGSAAARVTIVEFTDFECSYCGSYARQTLDKIVDEYVKTGKVRYVARNFPLEELHPLALPAAMAAMCANEQGKYWEAHRLFFDNQPVLHDVITLPQADAGALGIDKKSFDECTGGRRYAKAIQRDLLDGVELGVKGTPTLFVGYSDPTNPSQIRPAKAIVGAAPAREIRAAIESLLESKP